MVKKHLFFDRKTWILADIPSFNQNTWCFGQKAWIIGIWRLVCHRRDSTELNVRVHIMLDNV